MDRYGRRIPPYRETRDYVRKIGSATEVASASRPKAVIYKILETVEGVQTIRYSNRRPVTGTYEIIGR